MGRKIYESPSMRHRHQRGSLSPAGRTSRKYWLGRWHEYRTVNGKEVRHPCTANLGCCSQVKKWEARKELDKLVAASQNTKAKPEAKTVGWFWENRFIAARSAGWEEPTAKGNKSDYRPYIMPALHEANLADVDRYRCQNHIDELAARGISRSVISRVKVLMSSIFREALYDDLIPKNPMERVKLPKDCVVPCNATIPREQLENLLAHVSDLRDWTILAIAIFGELRSEELFALTWPCVGPDYVDIQDTCWRGKFRPGKVKTNDSRRTVFLPPIVMAGLNLWREACPASKWDLLFPGEVECMWPDIWRQDHIYPIARKLGFTVMPSNQVLRRSGQTRNQYNGSMKDQQAHMGHVAGSAVTNRVYTQADMDGLRAMVRRDAESSFKIKLPLAGREPEGGLQ